MSVEIETDLLATHFDNHTTLRQLDYLRHWQLKGIILERRDLTSFFPEESFLDRKRLDPELEQSVLGVI